ncbi:MAG: lipopolysaccharide transport system ATP-binding protein [Acidobacteriota bacterium]|nr:lipopolysaccharide transport system ATP-binding protein [Acidobacteriota bacterium]
MKPIIRIEKLSKQYRIGARKASYGTLGEALAGSLRAPLSRLRARPRGEILWALKDVNIDVLPGESVALVGRNGAGKSTLLKILSRVTEPTAGRVELYGRVGSLLEVGTGFHPELTGRENIFLNGAILGMAREEIKRKFDEIVAFSGIERFIDTPVKWYSSGMYVRLAFSVAAHLDPEILILDEVLAVGDSAFQIKCLNKMQEIRNAGRTILFVSHNMQSVTRLCKRAIYLSDGLVVDDGPAQQVAGTYLSARARVSAERTWDDPREAPGDDVARLRAVRVRTEDGAVRAVIDIRKPVGIEMEFDIIEAGHVIGPNFHFFNEENIYLFVSGDQGSQNSEWQGRARPAGRYRSTVWIPGNYLAEGILTVNAALSSVDPVAVHFNEPSVVAFQVVDSHEGDSARGDYKGEVPGVVRPMLPWTTEFSPVAPEATRTFEEQAV